MSKSTIYFSTLFRQPMTMMSGNVRLSVVCSSKKELILTYSLARTVMTTDRLWALLWVTQYFAPVNAIIGSSANVSNLHMKRLSFTAWIPQEANLLIFTNKHLWMLIMSQEYRFCLFPYKWNYDQYTDVKGHFCKPRLGVHAHKIVAIQQSKPHCEGAGMGNC